MDVENHLYARKDIKQLGIAPMTSMFSCGTNERRMVSGTSVFRQKVKYQLRFTLQHQWSGWMLAWLNSPRCQMAQSLSL